MTAGTTVVDSPMRERLIPEFGPEFGPGAPVEIAETRSMPRGSDSGAGNGVPARNRSTATALDPCTGGFPIVGIPASDDFRTLSQDTTGSAATAFSEVQATPKPIAIPDAAKASNEKANGPRSDLAR